MISQTETAGANQYGFYAVPKALEPKKKYRDNVDDEYEDEDNQEDLNPYATIQDREAVNERSLERDYYVDEAPYPEFKPRERGLDFGVQIERGDLFDFDLEVRPLIEILVGRSVVSALNQLQEEKQREERKSSLDKYQKKRNAELMVTQRLEAKHKRKLEETERRRLQKEVYVKNQKEAGKKLIARRNAKESLLGLKNDLFIELEDAGYLRADPTSDLKIKYEEWLYEKIMEALRFKAASETAASRLIEDQEKSIAKDHKKHIEQQMARRQTILDERQRVRKETQERKQKKRIRKMRQKLNAEREPNFIRFDELMEKYEQVTSILKFGDRSNGFTRNYAPRASVYISGGLDNFIIALLQSSGKDFSSDDIELILMKLITDSGKELEFGFASAHFDKIQEAKKKLDENKGQFMRDKDNIVKELAEEIALDLSLLEATSMTVKSTLHNRLVEAILNIYLTAQPEATEENPIDFTDQEKKRLDFADKISIQRQEGSLLNRVQTVDSILRVHFEIPESEAHSEAHSDGKQENKEEGKEEWIDIFDGEGWSKRKNEAKKESNKTEQQTASYALTGFENSFVFDERTLHYLQIELQKLLELNGGDRLKHYCENLSNLRVHLKKDLPVFDSQLHWN